MSDFLERLKNLSPKRLTLLALELQSKLEKLEQANREPLAIIGLGCRFPGAESPAAFWQLLREGRDAIREVPKERWDIDSYYDSDPDAPGKMSTRYGGFLEQVDRFDPLFFGIASREAISMDPQQRLLLEVTWEALEHAGIAPESLEGSATGVFIGICSSDYPQLLLGKGRDTFDAYSATGSSHAIASGRLSYLLGVHGPSLSIDTACSSSLVAVHQACLNLRTHSCRMAIAGGVNVMLSPDITITLSKAHMMSPDGRCKTFDASANGFVRGEGCGIVVLKRLRDALADGDNVLALILSSAVNQDGRSSGITAPNGPAQEAVMREALNFANVAPAEIGYVETHGTGTSLGDPIEVNALGAVLGYGREQNHRLKIGSVKTNFGHLEGAAGVAGLIKLVLALQHKQIPPHLHLNERNPYIPWEQYPIDIPTVLTPWEEIHGRRIGATSSFGFSGTNAHVIVAEAGEQLSNPSALLKTEDGSLNAARPQERPWHLLTLSAKSESALRDLASRYEHHFEAYPDSLFEGGQGSVLHGANDALPNICFTANTGRSHFSHRVALLAESSQQMQDKLRTFAAGALPADAVYGELPNSKRPEVVFLFTGQGAQYLNMGRRLYETQPTFRKAMDRCDEILRPLLKTSLLEVLYSEANSLSENSPLEGGRGRVGCDQINWDEVAGRENTTLPALTGGIVMSHEQPATSNLLDQTAFTQPALFAIEYALAELWRSWGVEPAAVMGHSVGEYVAACVAGVFSLEDGLKLIAERSRLMQALPSGGVMVAFFASEEKVAAAISSYRVAIAAINGPENVVLSGDKNAVGEVVRKLAAQNVQCRPLNVSHAFHSPLMLPMLENFSNAVNAITFHEPKIPLISNLTARPIRFESSTNLQPATNNDPQSSLRDPRLYWCRHVREAVRFSASIEWLHQQGFRIFVEVGPNPTLLGMAAKCLPAGAMVAVPALRKGKDDWQQMLHGLATLYTHNVAIDWRGFDADYARRKVVLPTYPFQRERFWIAAHGAKSTAHRDASAHVTTPIAPCSSHPLLGYKLRGPLHIFETQLSLTKLAMMDQHRAHGVAVVPGVVFLEMTLAAVTEVFGAQSCCLEDVVIHEAITLPEEESRAVQLILTPETAAANLATFQFFSSEATAAGQPDTWRLHASGKLKLSSGKGQEKESVMLQEIQARCDECSVEILVEQVRNRGIEVTAHSQSIAKLWRREGEALGLIEMNEAVRAHADEYRIHPALLDTCLQVLEAALPSKIDTAGEVYMLMGLERLEYFQPPSARMWAHTVLRDSAQGPREILKGEAFLFDENGKPFAKFFGLQFKRVAPEAMLRMQYQQLQEWLYEVQWRPQPRSKGDSAPPADFFPKLTELAQTVQPGIAQIYSENSLELYDELLPRLDALCGAYVVRALQRLGWEFQPGRQFTLDEIMPELHVQTRHHRLFERLLLMLEQDGVLMKSENAWQVLNSPVPQDTTRSMNELLAQYPACASELTIAKRCCEELAQALRGDVDPLQLLFPGGSLADTEQLYQEAPNSKAFNLILQNAVAAALKNLPEDRTLRVLEIGGGTGGTATRVLPILPAERTEYVFTDIGQLFTARAAQKFKDYPFVRYQVLDISADPETQGFALHRFDLVIAANVLHATSDLRRTLSHVQKLLASQGLLVLLEGTMPQRFGDLTVGLTEGWWSYTDRDLRADYALLSENKWLDLLTSMNFTEAIALPQGEDRQGVLQTQAVLLARGPVVERWGGGDTETGRNGDGEIHGEARLPSSHARASWLVLADESGVAQTLAQMLEARGDACVLVHASAGHALHVDPSEPEDCKRVLHEAMATQTLPCRGVINLWPLAAASEPATLNELRARQMKLVGGALHLMQALAANEKLKASRLWFITRNAQRVAEAQSPLALAQSPLWGLGKVIAMEHPELHCTRIDLDHARAEAAARFLYDEIHNDGAEDQIALRSSTRYVPRLVRSLLKIVDRGSWIVDREHSASSNDPQSTIIAPHSSYLITGGLAGLGLLIAQWMVAHGARHLVLISRSAPNEYAQAAVREMESRGAQIVIEQADVADEMRMTEVFSHLDQTLPRLRGVIHSAGAIDDGVLLQQDWSRFEKVMQAKVFGTWNLHTHTQSRELDFFIMFSTGASLIGSAGQGNHAAANMFMDTLAHHRRALGLPALSINWGAWSEIGTVARHHSSERFTSRGKSVITPAQGLKIFERLLRDTPPQVGVLPVNWTEVFEEMGERKNSPFFAELLRDVKLSGGLRIDDRGSSIQHPASSIQQPASSNQHPVTSIQ
ncbi:SDR family NAD(P)-dependent oxidoreductase [candidate division KSB1 bacterium]|nr:SDR family NAD(P)-dependent oxidoreductase [candidate division KSB1 bacterium]